MTSTIVCAARDAKEMRGILHRRSQYYYDNFADVNISISPITLCDDDWLRATFKVTYEEGDYGKAAPQPKY